MYGRHNYSIGGILYDLPLAQSRTPMDAYAPVNSSTVVLFVTVVVVVMIILAMLIVLLVLTLDGYTVCVG